MEILGIPIRVFGILLLVGGIGLSMWSGKMNHDQPYMDGYFENKLNEIKINAIGAFGVLSMAGGTLLLIASTA